MVSDVFLSSAILGLSGYALLAPDYSKVEWLLSGYTRYYTPYTIDSTPCTTYHLRILTSMRPCGPLLTGYLPYVNSHTHFKDLHFIEKAIHPRCGIYSFKGALSMVLWIRTPSAACLASSSLAGGMMTAAIFCSSWVCRFSRYLVCHRA